MRSVHCPGPAICRFLVCCLIAFAVPALVSAEGPSLKDARQRWLKGNYEEARSLYETLAKEAHHRDAAALGISRTWQSQGDFEKALAVIDTALRDSPKNSDLHGRRAELLHLRGRWDEADKEIQAALDLNADHFLARWVRAQLNRDRGNIKEADAEFRWFVRTYSNRSEAEKDIVDPDELLLVGLAGSENARWNKLSDQFEVILNDIYADALKNDKDFWPAEYQAGMLLLEKYNRGDALDAFSKALAINPHAAEALVGKGQAALQKLEIQDADRFAERALKINPTLPDALRLRADVYLAGGDVAKAMAQLDKARQVNPRDESTLGRMAACLYLQHKEAEFRKLAEEVERFDPKAGLFYFIVGEQLDDRRRFDEAEKYYRKSAELRPMLPWPQNSLGLLYMRMGREKEARELLTKAFAADAFNVRVSNSLKVLRHLDKYETIKTTHFELRYDPKLDQHLAHYMARYLEEIYKDLADKFQFKPQGPFLIEVFNNHEMFSGRTIALPDLHTIGACTGRMVAMVSPRGKDIRKPFNWARVLRHELVHIFNLDQTKFQVPHWLTEGLAVINEGFPRPQQWNRLLLERVPAGRVMNLDNINLGFIKPGSSEDWHLAYCQSQIYVEYLKEKFGPRKVGELLDAYRDGLDTPAAITKVCQVDKETFEKGYTEYLQGVLATLKGKPGEKALDFKQMRQAHEKDPDNPDLAAKLAVQYLDRGQRTEARKLAEAVLEKVKDHPLACYVKARLLKAGGDEEAALKLLEAAVDTKAPEPRVLEALGALYYEAGKFDKAAEIYELARQAQPFESKWLTELVRVYTQAGDKEKQIQILKELVPADADDLLSRRRLAKMLLDTGNQIEAERYARQALEIDVLDVDAERTLGNALLGQKKWAEAIETYQVVLELDKDADETRLKLAQAYLESGQKEKADTELARVEARDPDNAEVKRLRTLIKEK